MREPTQNEIENKPAWAKYYYAAEGRAPIFYAAPGVGTAPIPRKEFDINEYDFKCKIEITSIGHVMFKNIYGFSFTFNKQDTIALAKHFKLTADDLI